MDSPAPGGEDAEFFRIGAREFLAVASIRTGAGPYDFNATSTIFEWEGSRFVPFQEVPTFAAKQWKHWEIGGRHFLGLAQGVVLPARAREARPSKESVVYEWTGTQFAEFQQIPSQWAYNWHAFSANGEFFIAHAEHRGPSVLYRWDGSRLVPHQELAESSGRAFATFEDAGETYLVVACVMAPSRVLRLDVATGMFTEVQVLDGLGARELKAANVGGRTLVIRVNFILGTPADPRPELESQVYEWDGGQLHAVATFPTCGGTDVAVIETGDSGTVELIVTNSVAPDLTFAAHTVRYTLTREPADA